MKKKTHTITFNSAIYMIKTISTMLFPLITIPYVTRIIGVDGYGKVNFISSIMGYFVLLASLGISTYGIREGVRVKNDKKKFDSLVSELFTINIISTIVSYSFFVLFIFISDKMQGYLMIAFVLSIKILLQPLSLEWIYNVFEDYIFITVRTIIVQIVSLIVLFVIVRNRQDICQYAIYLVVSSAGINVFNYIYSKKYCTIKIKCNKNMIYHVMPIFILFFASIASQIYVNADTTMLGFMKNDRAVGLYTAATNIYNMLRTILGALITVFSARLAYMFVDDRKKFNLLFGQLIQILIMLSVPISIGCIFLANDMILILNGGEYLKATTALKILSIALNFSVVGSFYASSVLIPSKQEKIILIATSIGAILNIGLNTIAIKYLGIYGAAITTCISEIVVMIIQIYYSNKFVKNVIGLKSLLKLLPAFLGVYLVCFLANIFWSGWLKIIISFLGSLIIYFLVLVLTKNPLIYDLKKYMCIKENY